MTKMTEIIKVGDIVEFHHKTYVVVDYHFDFGGNVMIVSLVKTGLSLLKIVKDIYDEQINECILIKDYRH
jgi:hypothetical protein